MAICITLYGSIHYLLIVPSFIAAPEVSVAVGNVLTSAYKEELVSETDAQAIEDAIMAVPNTNLILRYEKPESIRNRLLKCIPEGELRSPESKALGASLAVDDVR